eukprot:6471232-Amphidinium_carterae.1
MFVLVLLLHAWTFAFDAVSLPLLKFKLVAVTSVVRVMLSAFIRKAFHDIKSTTHALVADSLFA